MVDYGESGELLLGMVKLTMEHACSPSYVLAVKYGRVMGHCNSSSMRMHCFFP